MAPSAAPNDPPLLGENEKGVEEDEAEEESSEEEGEVGGTSTHEPAPPSNVRMWRAPAHDIAGYVESYPAVHTGRLLDIALRLGLLLGSGFSTVLQKHLSESTLPTRSFPTLTRESFFSLTSVPSPWQSMC